MDPKNLSQLDPKLREVYERVMGTSVNPVKPPAASNEALTPLQNPATEPVPPQPEKPVVQPTLTAVPQSSKVEMSIKPKAKISPLIIGLAAVVFLVVYAIVWIKVFNLQLPFLP